MMMMIKMMMMMMMYDHDGRDDDEDDDDDDDDDDDSTCIQSPPFPLFLFFILFTGVDPLRVYIHDEGLTRISTSKYSLKNLDNKFAHLTNYSINKNADVFKGIHYRYHHHHYCYHYHFHYYIYYHYHYHHQINTTFTAASFSPVDKTNHHSNNNDDNVVDPEMEGYKWSLAAFRRWLARREGTM